MIQGCESLQGLCRRVIIRAVGSKRLLYLLPLPLDFIHWLRKYEEPTVFDPKFCARGVVFSRDNETITYTGNSYSTTPIFTPYGHGYTRGKHEWVFYFHNCRGQVAVSIIPVALKFSGNLQTMPAIGNEVGWAYNQNGYFTYEVPLWESKNRYSASYSSWDMIGILLDLDKGTLGFMLNGQELGIACDKGLCGHEVVPAVCLCSQNEKATFISSRIFL